MKKEWTFEDLSMNYDINFDKIIEELSSPDINRVLLQFPEGLKPYATSIVDFLEEKTGREFIIWLGNCFGACDYPVGIESLEVDLMIQIGHSSLMPDYLTSE